MNEILRDVNMVKMEEEEVEVIFEVVSHFPLEHVQNTLFKLYY